MAICPRRFDFQENRWQGRWYDAREGVPGEDILLVRPCIHEGKPKLLVLSQPHNSSPGQQDLDKFLGTRISGHSTA